MHFHKHLMNNNCEKHKILGLPFNCNDHMEMRLHWSQQLWHILINNGS